MKGINSLPLFFQYDCGTLQDITHECDRVLGQVQACVGIVRGKECMEANKAWTWCSARQFHARGI